MRRALIALALALCAVDARADVCSTTSPGPCAPPDFDSQRDSIIAAIRAGLGAESLMRENMSMRERAAVSGDDESELAAWTAARSAEARMNDAFDRAIRSTVDAYRLSPRTPPEPRAATPKDPGGRWSANIDAPWSIRFRTSAYRTIMGADKEPHHVSDAPARDNEGAVFGLTDPDGQTSIFPIAMEWSSFSNHPGILALTIYHETRHYVELVTTGWDTHEGGELRANTASLEHLDLFVPSTSPDGNIRIRALFADSLKKAIEEDRAAMDSGETNSPFPTSEQEAQYALAERKETALEEEFAALGERVRRKRQDDEDRLAAAQRGARWAQFNLWTLYACEYIDGIHPNDPEWGFPDRIKARDEFLRGYLHGHLVVMGKDEIEEGLRRNDLYRTGDLGSCQRRMISMIQDLPGPVDGDWLLEKIEFERRGGRVGEAISGLIGSIARAVADGTAALVRTARSPFASGRDPRSPERDRPGREPMPPDDGSARKPDIEKLPWQQLRGISAHGW